jgi:PTH1 family peptidyl-tRNA hydrolase
MAGSNWRTGFSGLVTDCRHGEVKVVLLKPQTYVNLSGRSVGELCRYYEIEPADLLVISDDYNLPLGRLRLRLGGASGGHKGLTSIIGTLGPEFHRLRIGIGEPKFDAADFVLSRFSPAEREVMDIAVRTAGDAAADWLHLPLERVCERYNGLDLENPARPK